VERCGLEVVGMDLLFDRAEAEVVAGAVGDSAFDTAAGE
jgi:hypothetical protein